MIDRLTLLEERISALERRNRLLGGLAALALVVGGVPYLFGAQAATDVVRASRFEVMRDGRAVAIMTSTDQGGSLEVRQNNGTEGGYLRSTSIGTSLDIRDSGGKVVAYLDGKEEGGAVLCAMMGDAQRCALELSTSGTGGIVRLRSGSDSTAELSSDLTGGRLQLWDFARLNNGPAVIDLAAGAFLMTLNGFRGTAQLGDLGVLVRDRNGNTVR